MIHAVRTTRDKAQMKGGEKKQREKGENKIKCSEREIGESGVKREEAEDRLWDKYVRCMLQFTAPPLHMTTVFGTLPKDIAFFSWLCQENYRHEAPELLGITSYIFFPPCLQKKKKTPHFSSCPDLRRRQQSDSEGKVQQSRMR